MRQPINILIVDDDPSLVSAARALLSRRDCHIDAVFSGMDAVSRVRAGGIDAVLLDVWMPEVTGLSVLEEIARLPSPPRVVLMSGNIDAKVEQAVADGRALACLAKPIDFDLALTLLAGEAPERPLQLSPDLGSAELSALASQVLSRGTGFLEGAPQLPAGTPVALGVSVPSGNLQLLAVSDPTLKPAGKRGLSLRFADLTSGQQQALRAVTVPTPDSAPPPPREAPIDRAGELYRLGLEKLENGRYDVALHDLRAARDMHPTDVLIAAALARAEELAAVEKARVLFKKAEELGNEPQQALKLVEDAIRLDPNRATYHREAGRLYLQLGDSLQQAEERLSAAIHLAPSDPSPRIHLAQMLERAGRHKEALWACEAAMHLFPGDKELQKIAYRLKRKTRS